jgi:Family of unknown function (DUF6042)
MTSERARKRKIRARMAVTGEPFTVAARALGGDTVSFIRTGWGRSGWTRLLPLQSLTLETIISTATIRGQNGTLQELISRHVAGIHDLPQGVDTVLTWDDGDSDEQTDALRQRAKAAFHATVVKTGRSVPTTVAELAGLLTEVGVYQHISEPNGVHRWRAETDVPLVGDVLPLPFEWAAHEDNVRWRTVTARAAFGLSDHFRQRGRIARLDTTIERLGTDCATSTESVRNALDGMVYRNWLIVQRHEVSVDRGDLRQLPDHARIVLVLDWAALDDGRVEEIDDEEDIDLSNIVWSASPWTVYQHVSQDPQISSSTLAVLSQLPFQAKKSDGSKFLTCLDEIAVSQGMSVKVAVDALGQLEQAGLVRWDTDHQHLEIVGPDGSVGDSIFEVITQGRA